MKFEEWYSDPLAVTQSHPTKLEFCGMKSSNHFPRMAQSTFSITEICHLGWQLPQVMPNYSSVTLYHLFWRGNGVTQIRVVVNPLCEL